MAVRLHAAKQESLGFLHKMSSTPDCGSSAYQAKDAIRTWNAPMGDLFDCPPHPSAPGLCVMISHRTHWSNTGCAFFRNSTIRSRAFAEDVRCSEHDPERASPSAKQTSTSTSVPSLLPEDPERSRSRLSTRSNRVGGFATAISF